MSLEETEVNVGGVKFKGMHIAIVLGIISSIAGTIWTASSIYSRLEAVEAYEICLLYTSDAADDLPV